MYCYFEDGNGDYIGKVMCSPEEARAHLAKKRITYQELPGNLFRLTKSVYAHVGELL